MPLGLTRHQQEDHLHFLTFSCYRRLPFLNDDHSRITFEHILETLRKRHRFHVHGYVLMPEHVHLLLSEPENQPLKTTLNVLKAETSKPLKGDRKQFWQIRYDFNVFTEKKRIEKLRYMHRNPVARGLVSKPEDWPWSSYLHYLANHRGRIKITQ